MTDAGWQDGSATFQAATLGHVIVPIVYAGTDLAKNVFALHSVDETGRAALVRPSIRRNQLLELVAKLPPCTVGMEACSGAHHWGRQFVKFGHIVKLMAPTLVAPYRMSGTRAKERRGWCWPGHENGGGEVLSARTRRSTNRARQALKMAAMSLPRNGSALGTF